MTVRVRYSILLTSAKGIFELPYAHEVPEDLQVKDWRERMITQVALVVAAMPPSVTAQLTKPEISFGPVTDGDTEHT